MYYGKSYRGKQHTLYRSEETSSSKKFENLKSGIIINDKTVTLNDIVARSPTTWEEQEWEFPKERNYKENDMECAFRPIEEETGMSRRDIRRENVIPAEEYFVGSNFKAYKHKFYLAYTSNQELDMTNYQRTEVSRMQWMNLKAVYNVYVL